MNKQKKLGHVYMIFCALLVGVTVSLSVILFIKLFSSMRNIFFSQDTPFSSFLGVGIILIPVFGSFVVTWLIENFSPNEKGLSVSEVIYSIHFKKGNIRPGSAFAKAIASVISIGTGGSIGREGPIVQLSAAFSAIISDVIHISTHQKVILMAAGAAAGTAVMFNSPLGGLLFAVEILLCAINFYSIAIIVISETIALCISHALLGKHAIFSILHFQSTINQPISNAELLSFIPIGIFAGIFSILFIRGLYLTEDLFSKYFKNAYIKHAFGMLLVGCMLYLLMRLYGHYYIEGIGFSTINDVLNFLINNTWLLLLILVFKFFATFFTLGSGASGGIFSPSLFIGAMLGALWGNLYQIYFPVSDHLLLSFVITGMSAMLAGVTGGILTSIALCVEITKDFQTLLPLLITTALAFITRKKFCEDNIYIYKLKQRHINMNDKENY